MTISIASKIGLNANTTIGVAGVAVSQRIGLTSDVGGETTGNKSLTESIDKLGKSIQELAQKMTSMGQENKKGAIEKTSVFVSLAGGVVSIIDAFSKNGIRALVLKSFESITKFVSSTSSTLLFLGRIFLQVFSNARIVISAFVSKAIGGLIASLKTLSLAALKIGISLLPITLIGTAIAGVAFLIYKNWEPISQFFTDIGANIKQAFDGGIISGFVSIIENAVGIIIKSWIGLSEALGLSFITERLQSVLDLISNVSQFIQDFVSSDSLAALGGDIFDGLKGVANFLLGPDKPQPNSKNLFEGNTSPIVVGSLKDQNLQPNQQNLAANVGGELLIKFDAQGRPIVDRIEKNGDMDIAVVSQGQIGGTQGFV